MDPKTFLSLSKEERSTYLKSLSDADRMAFVETIDNYQYQLNNPGDAVSKPMGMLPVAPPDLAAIGGTAAQTATPPVDLQEIGGAAVQPAAPKAPPSPNDWKEQSGKLMDRLSTLSNVTTTFVDLANLSDPANTEIAPSAISRGISGAVEGFAVAGPLGAVAGGALNAISGAVQAGNQREAYDEQQENKKRRLLNGLRVAPTIQEKGGIATNESDIEIPVQEEEGEIMFFPDGRLVDSMAEDTHKEMRKDGDEEKVTDIIPNRTMIFSNSDKKLIDLSKIKEDIFQITKGTYSEDGNVPGETILMGAVLGRKGKKTPAALARKVRDDFPVIEYPVEQFEIDTNRENLRRRAEILLPIMQMQEGTYKKFEFEKPMIFEKGGIAMRKEKKKKAIQSYEKGTGDCGVGMMRDEYGNCVPDPSYQVPVTPQAMMPSPFRPPVFPSPVQPPVPPPEVAPVAAGATTLPRLDNQAFDAIDRRLDESNARIDTDYNTGVANAENLYRSHRFRNMGILATKLLGQGFQNPEVTPATEGTELINEMYPNVTESQIRSQVNPIRQSQNRVLASINDSGIPGSQVGSSIASTQSRLIEAEGEVRNKALTINQSQNAARFAKLHEILKTNAAAEVGAENATRSNRNMLVSNVAEIGADALSSAGSLKEALNTNLANLRKWKQENKDQVTQDQFNKLVKEQQITLERGWYDKINTQLGSLVQKFIVQG